jgi:hypothetical protein
LDRGLDEIDREEDAKKEVEGMALKGLKASYKCEEIARG